VLKRGDFDLFQVLDDCDKFSDYLIEEFHVNDAITGHCSRIFFKVLYMFQLQPENSIADNYDEWVVRVNHSYMDWEIKESFWNVLAEMLKQERESDDDSD
jgi:hypothetical protein